MIVDDRSLDMASAELGELDFGVCLYARCECAPMRSSRGGNDNDVHNRYRCTTDRTDGIDLHAFRDPRTNLATEGVGNWWIFRARACKTPSRVAAIGGHILPPDWNHEGVPVLRHFDNDSCRCVGI